MEGIADDIFSQAGIKTVQTREVEEDASRKKDQSLGQDDFMKLLTTQLTHQDPMKPVENGEFVAQMAQFGMLSGIQEMQKDFATLTDQMVSSQNMEAAGMIGRQVLISTDGAHFDGVNSVTGSFPLEVSAQNMAVNIHNEGGQLVKTIDMGANEAGIVGFSWDGTDNAGNKVASGNYKVTANGLEGGEARGFDTFVNFEVKSVVLGKEKGTLLNLADGSSVKLDDVDQIQ